MATINKDNQDYNVYVRKESKLDKIIDPKPTTDIEKVRLNLKILRNKLKRFLDKKEK
jgi:hypothetical protein